MRALRRPLTPTHPRVCGEHQLVIAVMAMFFDSPPRVRGARHRLAYGRRDRRLTPACAGSTAAGRLWFVTHTTHPRVCGEHSLHEHKDGERDDSPPRVRGALQDRCQLHLDQRLTPACAGSTPPGWCRLTRGPTHPRVCGEHMCLVPHGLRTTDSPPRVRGAPEVLLLAGVGRRLTPACAGSTCRYRSGTRLWSTHPRVCGEHAGSGGSWQVHTDSPPRVRGAPFSLFVACCRHRLTPACAGSTGARQDRLPRLSTHPRVCGEHRVSCRPPGSDSDSPPRVRGARCGTAARRHKCRLTPACAGSTSEALPVILDEATHPRVCGEHTHGTRSSSPAADSPPRVRGAPCCPGAGKALIRLTPACAGSTRGPVVSDPIQDDSPPRVRGALDIGGALVARGRLTPACAGSTC